MRKIIIGFDGANYPAGALEFAAYLNEANRLLLTGVFVPNVSFSGSLAYPAASPVAGGYGFSDEDTIEAMEKNIEKFEQFCRHNDIEYRIHRDTSDFAIPELRYETRYADLMFLGAESLDNTGAKEISVLFKDVLHFSECPVIITTQNFFEPEHIVLAYDGSEDCVYAIKQFAYLFPELTGKKTILVYIDPKAQKDIPELMNIEELVARHYVDLTIERLELEPEKYFPTWLNSNNAPLLVAGSYGRSSTSRFFKKSFINGVLEYGTAQVFIAHH